MITRFNPTVSNNRNQRTNFKALPIEQITKNAPAAEKFRMDVAKGKIPKTDENVRDLFNAIDRAKDVGIKCYLQEVADEMWQVKR